MRRVANAHVRATSRRRCGATPGASTAARRRADRLALQRRYSHGRSRTTKFAFVVQRALAWANVRTDANALTGWQPKRGMRCTWVVAAVAYTGKLSSTA